MVAKSDTPKPSPTRQSPKGGGPQKPKAETPPEAMLGGVMMNTVAAVRWDNSPQGGSTSGMLTVTRPLNAAYNAFVVNGLTFRTGGAGVAGTTFGFIYSGPMSPAVIRNIVRPGEQICLSN